MINLVSTPDLAPKQAISYNPTNGPCMEPGISERRPAMKKSVDDKQLAASIVLLERFVRDIYPSKHSSEIQPLQWSILRYLSRMPPDRCELRWIAQFLGLTRAPVTRALATLEARELVTQKTSGTDARTKTVVLTSDGMKILEEDPVVQAVKKLRLLSESDQADFVKIIRTLALSLEGGDSA